MKGRRRIWWLAVSMVLLLLAALLFLEKGAKEQKYHRKTAAQWFQQFRQDWPAYTRNSGRFRMTLPDWGASNVLNQTVDEDRLSKDPAADALRALGTNSAVYLAKEIRRQDSRLTVLYRNLFRRFPLPFHRVLPKPAESRNDVRWEASLAMNALGTDAAVAVPLLIAGLYDPDPSCRYYCCEVLRHLPFNPADIDPVLQELSVRGKLGDARNIVIALQFRTATGAWVIGEGLSDPLVTTRRDAALRLRDFGFEAGSAVPRLAAALKDSDPDIRRYVAYALERLGPRATAAVPDLITAMGSEDKELRYFAARALGRIGTSAAVVVPVLIRATNDTDEPVRHAAAQALQRIGQ